MRGRDRQHPFLGEPPQIAEHRVLVHRIAEQRAADQDQRPLRLRQHVRQPIEVLARAARPIRAGAADRPRRRWFRRRCPPAGSPRPGPACRSPPDGTRARSPRTPAPARSPRSPTWSRRTAAASSSAPAAPCGRNPCAPPGRPASPSASRRDTPSAATPSRWTGRARARRCSTPARLRSRPSATAMKPAPPSCRQTIRRSEFMSVSALISPT